MTVPIIRALPPADGLHPDLTINGRKYTAALGSFADMPDVDAQVAAANGWTLVAGTVGASTARPANPSKGESFHDTTLGLNIKFDGKVWRNPATGGAV